jgi:hypothetical protein
MYEIEIQDSFRDQSAFVVEVNSSPVQKINGKTGVVVIEKNDIGLNRVDNTADIDKPISNAVAAALLELEQKFLNLAKNVDTDVDFDVNLPYGVDRMLINYPKALEILPSSIYCYIKNNDDDVVYENSISEITKEGFLIEFSDFLSSDAYILNVRVSF